MLKRYYSDKGNSNYMIPKAQTCGSFSVTLMRQAEASALGQQGLVHVSLPGAGVCQLFQLVPFLSQPF